jgi:hypothetical protein
MPHPVTLHGAERAYVLDCTRTQAMRQLEATTGLAMPTILRRLTWKTPPARLLYLFLQAALVEPLPLTAMRAVLRDIGGVAVIQAAVRDVLPPARRERREIAHV